MRVCSTQFSCLSESWKAMAGRMSFRRYLKSIDGLPDPKGSLSTTIPSSAIIRRIDTSLNMVAVLPITVQRVDVVTSHTVSHRPALSSMLMARSLKVHTLYSASIIIYRVKLFLFNFLIQIFLHIFVMKIY